MNELDDIYKDATELAKDDRTLVVISVLRNEQGKMIALYLAGIAPLERPDSFEEMALAAVLGAQRAEQYGREYVGIG